MRPWARPQPWERYTFWNKFSHLWIGELNRTISRVRECLLGSEHVPGTVLGSGAPSTNKTYKVRCPQRASILTGTDRQTGSNARCPQLRCRGSGPLLGTSHTGSPGVPLCPPDPGQGFPGGASGKEPSCQCRRHRRPGFYPWVGKIPWRRARQPTPASILSWRIPWTGEPGGL